MTTVIWSTGFVHDYRWINLPAFNSNRDPIQHRGVVPTEPGLYFVGLPFQSSMLSRLVAGAGDDAKYVVARVVRRAKATGLAYSWRPSTTS